MAALNHPVAGSEIKVDPIRSEKDIKNIKKLLADQPRNLAIFTLGINTNLRASDILKLTIGQVRHLNAGEHFSINEKKTGKSKSITINQSVFNALQPLLATLKDCTDSEPLFQSRKGIKALSVPSLNGLAKEWCSAVNLKGNYGTHTLRKTFGYMHRTVHNTSVPLLMEMFNHSSQKQTLAYLGIQPEEIKDAYLKEI